jgi:hypothetical protein
VKEAGYYLVLKIDKRLGPLGYDAHLLGTVAMREEHSAIKQNADTLVNLVGFVLQEQDDSALQPLAKRLKAS